jgi:hypothetical protein
MSNELEGEVVSEKALSKKQQRFFGIVRAIQKGEQEPTTPETAKAAADMKKSDVKKYASTKHTKLPEKKKVEEKLDKKDIPFLKDLAGKLSDGAKKHKKQSEKIKLALNTEDTAIESELVIQDWNKDDIKFTEIETVDIIKAKPLKENKLIDFVRNIGKTDFNKEKERIDKVFGPPPGSIDSDGNKVPDPYGIFDKNQKKKPKFPKVKIKSLKDFEKEAKKVRTEQKSNWRDELEEDWQKVNRKDKTDGLSKAAVKAYRRENPGSKLQTAVTTKPSKLKKGSKSAKRRLSFCRRMKGMKKKLTSAKTRRDPDSRINKALRRWNC